MSAIGQTPKTALKTIYYLSLKNGYVTVYKGSLESIYLSTDISKEQIPTSIVKELEKGINVTDLKGVYDYLESCSS
ncbi:hypothetical protein P261_00693 [Lachnospiraceae bacterium TWA4]|nr:hypothetical protein P261_00693 [Lachnospiraceae bacterium TWA4]